MAATTLTTLEAVITEQVQDTLTLLKDSADARDATGLGTLTRLFRIEDSPPTDRIRWNLLTTGGAAAAFNLTTGEFGTAQNQAYAQAELDWKGLHTTFRLSEHALDATGNGATMAGVGDLIAHNVEEAIRDLFLKLETQLMGDAGEASAEVAGLRSIVQATAPYAGIDPATQTYWQPLIDTTGGVWSEDKMDAFLEAYRAPGRNGSGRIAITGLAQFHKIGKVLKASNPVQYVGTTDLVAGVTGIRYEGVSIVPVAGYPNDRLDLVDPADFAIVMLHRPKVIELARTSHNRDFAITLTCNLKCRSPKNTASMQELTLTEGA
jgi:hypothetical protein